MQRKRPIRKQSRSGSMVVLAGVAFFALTALAGLAINIAYTELVRTEQRVATDAAAKAALVTLGKSQSRAEAIASAKQIASMHRVAGRAMALSDSDVQLGFSVMGADGKFTFTPVASNSSTVTNSIRINSSLSRVSAGGIPLIMTPQLMGGGTIQNNQFATSTRIELDVCLVVDRSASMAWSMSNTPFEYPGELKDKSPMQNYFQLAHPTLSRWAALRSSVNVFTNVLNEAPIKSRVALASYSSNFTFGIWTSKVASIDQSLTTTYTNLGAKLDALATVPLIGNTNIAAGMREGLNALTDPSTTRITSSKCMVLMTDGIKTQGDDPIEIATLARQMNIRIHTIAYSAQADVNLMRAVANAGGGQAYVALDPASLTAVFRTIATTLPNMLTE